MFSIMKTGDMSTEKLFYYQLMKHLQLRCENEWTWWPTWKISLQTNTVFAVRNTQGVTKI